jgi:hypothetical protein
MRVVPLEWFLPILETAQDAKLAAGIAAAIDAIA